MTITRDDRRTARAEALAQDLQAVVGKLQRRLRERASAGDLTPSQRAVGRRLEREGPATAAALARAEEMRPQSMGSIIAALEAAGLVSGRPDPNDGRRTLLSVTELYRKRAEEKRAARQDWLTRTLQARFSPQELEEFARGMELLKMILDDYSRENI